MGKLLGDQKRPDPICQRHNGCGGRAAMFLMDYSMEQKVAYDPVVTRMVRSLKPEDC